MTEHEKLLAGLEYDYKDPEIQSIIVNARTLLHEYNACSPGDHAKMQQLLMKMLGSCGSNVVVQQPLKLTYGVHIHVGNDVMINTGCTLLDGGIITIGDRVLLAPDVKIYTGYHSLDARERFKLGEDGVLHLVSVVKPVTIGSDVWIGGNVSILPGVTIGNNVVISAGAVVNKDIPDDCVAGGVPAKIIKGLPPLDEIRRQK